MKKLILFVFVFVFATVAFGDPSPTPSLVPIASAIDSWTTVLKAFLTSTGLVLLAGVADVVLRRIPSEKPMGVALAASQIFHALGGFLEAISKAIDAIVPQKLK